MLSTRRADLRGRTPTRACTWKTLPPTTSPLALAPRHGQTYLAVASAVMRWSAARCSALC